MRLYSFVNVYLSSIQQGIQTAHLVHEIFMNYEYERSEERQMLVDWAKNHKTIITLNGGANQDILNVADFLAENCVSFSFPAAFGSFREDDYSLNGTMTCTGLVVPEYIYGAVNWKKMSEIAESNVTYDKGTLDAIQYANIQENISSFFAVKTEEDGSYRITHVFEPGTPDWKLILLLKSCQLAR